MVVVIVVVGWTSVVPAVVVIGMRRATKVFGGAARPTTEDTRATVLTPDLSGLHGRMNRPVVARSAAQRRT
jgi:hypothetical protein